MTTDVKRWCEACIFCRKRKSHQDLKQGEPLVVPTGNKFGEIIACDLVGPLPETPDGHIFILVDFELSSPNKWKNRKIPSISDASINGRLRVR